MKKVFLFLLGAEFQDVPWLAVQGLTEGGEGRKTDGPGLVRLQDREVRKGDAHLFRKLPASTLKWILTRFDTTGRYLQQYLLHGFAILPN